MLDNTFTIIGKVVSPIKPKKNGSYEFNYVEVEVETGSTEQKNNVIYIKLTQKQLEKLKWNVGDNYSGTLVACSGTLVGTIYNGNNYINLQTNEIQVLLKANSKNQPRYTAENNYGYSTNTTPTIPKDEYDLADEDLPF